MDRKTNTLITLFFLSMVLTLNGFCQKTDHHVLEIVEFKTKIEYKGKDSTWNINHSIKLYAQPKLLSITVKEQNEDVSLDLICLLYEPIKNYDTLKLGTNPTINFSNLSGGDYELIFINLATKHQAKIKFSIEVAFWEKWWFSPFVFLVISCVLGLIFYFFYLVRLRSQLQLQAVRHELEIKALRAQMNPHFIFNSMNTIDAYILRKRFIEASDCLQKFSKLIRRILENSENQTISIAQELETLQLYIELEQERFSHSFSYRFDVEPMLTQKNYQIPPLLIQPFVENAILHGIRHLTERKGEIIIKLSTKISSPLEAESEVLFCEIEDNGIGRKASAEINLQRQASHKSMGMNVTMERISTYQAIYGDKMETKIIDLEEGTRVEIKLPLIIG